MAATPPDPASAGADGGDDPIGRYRSLTGLWRWLVAALTTGALALAVNQIFALDALPGGVVLESRYLYVMAALMMAAVFAIFPAGPRAARERVPWYDAVLAALTLAIGGYLAVYAEAVLLRAWEYSAPEHARYLALAVWALVLEVGRRVGGWPIFTIVVIFSFYPLYAAHAPDPVSGIGMGLLDTAAFHVYSEESLLGIPMQAFAMIVVGFLVFGATLQHTGGGRFFVDLAFALLGHVRGGPGKVAIFSSGLMSSMSGGPVTNVLTTGPLSIPAMRRTGFSAQYAAAVEACASTGGVLMPPVMGATAFVMANFLDVSYVDVVIAAIIPSLLYFFGLFMQIDAYAARQGLAGLPAAEMPRLTRVLRDGWYFVAVFALLVYLLVFLRREATAPFYAALLLIVINQLSPRHRLSWSGLAGLLEGAGRLLAELGGLLAAIGLIVGALTVTGVAGTLTNDLVYLAGGSAVVLLLMGAVTSFVLGIGMTVTAAYIFLAIVLAPALENAGLDPMAAHLFIMYWSMLSFITPPVAIGAFTAASVAGTQPMATGFEAMRTGAVIYFIPFFFVFNPALLMQGPWTMILVVLVTALAGVTLIAGGLQGYVTGFGPLGRGLPGAGARLLVIAGGVLLAVPGEGMLGVSHAALFAAAAAAIAAGLGLAAAGRPRAA